MANATAFNTVNMEQASVWYGDVTIATANHIQVAYGPYVQNYYGSFSYSSFGLAGGAVTSSNYYEFGRKIYEISGGSFSALTIESYLNRGDMNALLGYVFSGNDSFSGSGGHDYLKGFGGTDRLFGNGGNDTLDGGTGADTLYGGIGNDIYLVDNVAERVIEYAGQGVDIVRASVSFALPAQVEHLQLGGYAASGTGNPLDNRITGNASVNRLAGMAGNDSLFGLGGNDTLLGGAGNDILHGGSGHDMLNGGLGADTMRGNQGNDVYVVNSHQDRVIELAGQGNDTVRASVSHALTANVEALLLTGNNAINGHGNAMANQITGNAAGNRLAGLGGSDLLKGVAGADTLLGGGGNDRLFGGAGNDLLNGGLGADVLVGGDGADTLLGGPGRDRLTGGVGADRFRFVARSEGADTITDFHSGTDVLQVVSRNFGNLATGRLAPARFSLAGSPLSGGNAAFIYNRSTGNLFFDLDGAGTGVAVKMAELGAGTLLKAGDIQVIA